LDINDNDEISETEEVTEREKLTEFQYDVKNEEEDRAFRVFQKKYVYKHNIKITVAFGVVAALFGVSIIRYPDGYLNWVLMFICLFMIFTTWYNMVAVRKRLVAALKNLEDDRYIFKLFDDGFSIETIISEEERDDEEFVPIPPKEVKFGEEGLSVIENSEMFMLIIKKETIYVLSKRVLDEKTQEILRNKFTEALGENFERQ
jgi:hypothetical protein